MYRRAKPIKGRGAKSANLSIFDYVQTKTTEIVSGPLAVVTGYVP